MANNTPEVRFEGFSGEWGQTTLGKIFNQTAEYVNPGKSNLELWSVTVHNGLTPKTERYNREALVKKTDKFKAVHSGEIVYNPMNITIGAVGFNSLGKSVAVSGYYVTMSMNEGFSNNYFGTWLTSPDAIKKYKLYATGSLIEKQRVQFPTLSSIKVRIPSFEEQTKIGSFFKQLDDTIALQQQELDTLKQTKQGFLQKMFPKEGETVPEIRFPGFSGEWEERKLYDLTDVRDGTHDSPKYHTEGHPLVTSKNLTPFGLDMNNVSLISDEDFNMINKRSKVELGDILFGMIGTIGNPVLIEQNNFAIKNVALIKKGIQLKNEFLIQLLKSSIFNRYIDRENAGGTQKFLGLSQIRNFEFWVPTIEEQTQIGSFFKQLDDTIALHQQELDALKETKKAFLQKMFV